MILFKLFLLLAFIFVAVFIIRVGLRLIKEADSADVKEKINDINLKNDLVDDVDKYVNGHKDDIKKSQSTSVNDFLGDNINLDDDEVEEDDADGE